MPETKEEKKHRKKFRSQWGFKGKTPAMGCGVFIKEKKFGKCDREKDKRVCQTGLVKKKGDRGQKAEGLYRMSVEAARRPDTTEERAKVGRSGRRKNESTEEGRGFTEEGIGKAKKRHPIS